MDEVLQIEYHSGIGDFTDVRWLPFTWKRRADSLYEAEKRIDEKVAEWVTSLEADGAKDVQVIRTRRSLATHELFEAYISYTIHGVGFNETLAAEVRPQPE